MIKYAYASISEKGTINGKKGDQSGREVKIANEYDFGQDTILRAKKYKIRRRIRQSAMRLCKNENIGYGQMDRTSGFSECKKKKWKIRGIPSIPKCNMDCSILCVCAINMAFNKEMLNVGTTSHNLTAKCMKYYPFHFKKLKYRNGVRLKKGDILVRQGHCVVVCNDGIAKV